MHVLKIKFEYLLKLSDLHLYFVSNGFPVGVTSRKLII